MLLSHQKNNFSLQSQQRSNDFSTNNLTHSKVNVLPPKINRVPSVSSNLYSYGSVQSLSQQSRPVRNFSKNKGNVQLFAKPDKDSFNVPDTGILQNKDCFHRYSCNLDMENKNSFLKNQEKMEFSIERRDQSNLQFRVRALQQKMRKNEQNFKHYNEEIDNFKLQLSSSSLNLLDSINTNILTSSIKDPLRQISNNQIFNNKQNSEKNTLSFQKIRNSSNDLQIEKKSNQIELIKKQIKKIASKEQNLKSHVKLFHDSMKDMLKSFKDHLERSLENLIKRQDRNKKKIFEDVEEKIRQKIKEIQNSNSQHLKHALQNLENSQKSKNQSKKIQVGKERFIGDSLLMKVREQVFIQMIKRPQLDPFTSYVEMIKRSMANHDSTQQIILTDLPNQQKSDAAFIEKVVIQQAETTYFLDLQGYLLDSQGYYLMDADQKIKLTPSQLQKLQEHRILQNFSSQ